MRIAYRDGYRYQLGADYWCSTLIIPSDHVATEYILLDIDGGITIREGYAWDGPSGPTIDTPNFMRASLVHDALYQLMREGYISINHRQAADRLLQRLCREDGMSWVRAWWVYAGVRLGGASAAAPDNEPPLIWAPSPPIP